MLAWLGWQEGQGDEPRTKRFFHPPHRLFFWCLAILVGFLQIWAHRHDMNPDGVAYLDIATVGAQAGWKGFLNGYWSPLYPFLLSIVLGIFHPKPYSEATLVHFLNFAIYLANLACFEIFVAELLRHRHPLAAPSENYGWVPSRTLWIWGYLFFIWVSSFWLRPWLVTPDLCVAALAYVAMALLLRIHRGSGTWTVFALLGAVLGVAYLAKAAMFPLSFVFLACAFLVGGRASRALPRTMIALLVFAVIAGPLIVGLSEIKHRLSFGESGKINYAEFLYGVGQTNWQGEPPGFGTPIHPTRQVLRDPPLYEFATPLPGSDPVSYDLSYWSDGVKIHFSLSRQLLIFGRALNSYLQMFSRSGAIYAMLITLAFIVGKSGKWSSLTKGEWQLWLPAYAPLFMYSLVHVEARFIGGFVLMLFMGLFAGMRVALPPRQPLLAQAALAMIIILIIPVGWTAFVNIVDIVRPRPFEQWEIADGLQSLGVRPGSQIGFIGGEPGAYWARLAGVRIVAEIPFSEQARFWDADPAAQQKVLSTFAGAGAAIVVTCSPAQHVSPQGWQRISQTGCYMNGPARAGRKDPGPFGQQAGHPSGRNPGA